MTESTYPGNARTPHTLPRMHVYSQLADYKDGNDPIPSLIASTDPPALFLYVGNQWVPLASVEGDIPEPTLVQATEEQAGVAEIATQDEANAGADNTTIVTPARLAGRVATEDRTGLVEHATEAEVQAGTAGNLVATVARLKAELERRRAWEPGDLKPSARSSPPDGWLLCDGAAVSRTTYADLFSAIGTTHGSGNGTTTFNLPDLRGRAPIGAGEGTGLTNRALGAVVGAETHTLTTGQIPAHTHTYVRTLEVQRQSATTGPTGRDTGSTEASGSTGGGEAHNNMQPSLAVHFHIKT